VATKELQGRVAEGTMSAPGFFASAPMSCDKQELGFWGEKK
jgi:hypothetical protein